MEDIQEKYNHLLQQNEALRQENEELESLLHAHGIEYKPKHAEEKDAVYSPFTFPYVKLSIEERVAIFHSLFKGREDVFAQRWFSKTTGKSGYQPVCINEWKRGVCDKKSVFYNIRECTEESKGTYHLWSNGNPYPKRWTSAYHFHAMWSHSFLCRCKESDYETII